MRTAPRVEIVDFGAGGTRALLAEYDAESDTIRLSARVVERLRALRGSAEAGRFIASAVAHECFHRAQPAAGEAAAHAYAHRVTGAAPHDFAALALALGVGLPPDGGAVR